MRNRCVKFAFNNGSFGAYFPAYCEPITINKINHARLSFGFAVRFGVHFLPMACYCWLAVGGGVHFCRVRTAPKSPLYAHHLRCVLACGVGGGFAYPMA